MHISCGGCVAVLRYLLHCVCDQPLSVGESSVMTNPKSSVFSPLAVLKAQSVLVDPEHQVHSHSTGLSRGSLLCYLNQMSQQQTSSWVVIDAHVFKLSTELSQSLKCCKDEVSVWHPELGGTFSIVYVYGRLYFSISKKWKVLPTMHKYESWINSWLQVNVIVKLADLLLDTSLDIAKGFATVLCTMNLAACVVVYLGCAISACVIFAHSCP